MGLSRLENFLKSVRGNILYVDPNSIDSTDSIENQGNSLTRPFKTLQRALIEAARFSYQTGSGNDTFGKTTILLYPGEHIVDNRPGWIPDGANSFKLRNGNTSSSFTEFTLSSNFDLEDANNELYKLNSIHGGVIVPRGTSIVGLDLRKTKIRPKYVPDPTNDNIENSTIFRITGGCYFWQFSIFDANPNGNCYKNYNTSLFLPNFSHHKLSCFEYADGVNPVYIQDEAYENGLSYDRTDLEMYYEKIGIAYGQSSAREIPNDYPSASLDIEPRVDEYRIVGSTGQTESISAVSVNGTTITITLNTSIPDLEVDTPIRISGFSDSDYDGQYVVSEKVSSTQFKYKVQNTPSNPSPSIVGTTVSLVSDTVSSASPYIFNISLRSVFGMCGLLADGSKASGFKSMVVAQFTGIGLQKDTNAFVIYDPISGTFQDNTNPNNANIASNSRAIFKPSYKNFHIKCVNDAFIQCVSVFAIGYAEQFVVDSGGDQSITNSNSNFGAKALVASGFRNEAFLQDDRGYITHIVPPKEIATSEFSVEFDSIDVVKTVGVASDTKLYLYNRTNIDNPPENVLQGYRIGAKPDDKLNVIIDGQEFSATISPNNEKVSYVALDDSGLNDIDNKIITFTEPHSFTVGETLRVISDSGHLPDGISPNTVYYFAAGDTLTSAQIKLAKNQLDAINGDAITINNKGGRLKVVSRVSDKNSGDIGHPIQWDSSENQWYLSVESGSSLYTKVSTLSTSSTPRTYINRTGDDRNRSDLIYKFRYAIPKNIGGLYAKPPIEGYIIQESNTTTGLSDAEISTYFGTNSISNLNQQRNFRFISGATWSSGTANITTELPHNLTVGSKVEILNVKSTNNSSGAENLGYNGTYNVVGIDSSKHFSISIASDPGTFSNDVSTRNTSLPYFRRKNYKNTYYVYSIEEQQKYIEDEQDGVYYITILNSSNSPVNSPFTDEQYSQSIKELYPQINRDNPLSDPEEAKSFAVSSPVGNVIVNDVQNSITKETVSKFLSDSGVGIGITNIVSSDATNHVVYTDIDHGFSGITSLSLVYGGSAYGSGSGGTFYNARLVGFAGSVTGEGATVKITTNPSGEITNIGNVKIMDGGSAYGIGNTLSIVGVATTTGFVSAVVRVESVASPSNDAIRVSGVSSESYKDYNGVYKVSSVAVGSARSFSVGSANSVSNYSTSGIGSNVTVDSYFYRVGKSFPINNIIYDHISGIATVSDLNLSHSYYVNNKIKISGATDDVYNGDFIITKINTDREFVINIGIGTTSPIFTGSATAYPLGASSNDGVISRKSENISGRMVPLHAGTITYLSSNISSSNVDTITLDSVGNILIGDYLQIDDEIVRVKNEVTGNTITVFRGVLGTRAVTHSSSAAVKKISVKPVEFRRYSIIRASGHTFEYVGFGPGNYSTAFPDKQDRQISVSEELLAQGTSRNGGVNYYSGMNDQGVFYSGNKRLTRIGGQEEIFDTPLLTVTGEDIGNDRGVNLVNATEGNFTRSINVDGGPDGNAISEFNGPVVFNNKVTSLSSVEAESLFIQGNEKVSRKYTISDQEPTAAGNPGDVVYNSNPANNGYLGWVYTNQNEWKIFSKIGSIEELLGVGVGTTGGFVGFSTLINFKGTNINIETDFDSNTGISTINFIGSSVVDAISGYDIGGESGDYSTFIPVVSAGGTMEIGRYIDFHNASGDTSNYTFRLDNASAGILTAYGNLNVLAYGVGQNGDISLSGELNFGSQSSLSERYVEFYTDTNDKVYFRLLKSDAEYQTAIEMSRDGISVTGDINSTSDINLKTNIHSIDNALDKILQIRGVSFNWKETKKSSLGVIAQEIEDIIPEVVSGDETKMVNYNALIGVLIEAVKELKSEIDELKKNS
jgi:hypothetical protein